MSPVEHPGAPRVWPVAWAWWALAGAAFSVGVIALLSIGVVFLGVAVAMAIVGASWSRLRNRSAYLALVGAAAAPLLLAWLNRDGPGRVCHVDGTTTACGEQWSPWPFLVVAVLLVAAGTALARRAPAGPGRPAMPLNS